MSALAEALRAQARALELLAAALEEQRDAKPATYSKASPPPKDEAPSWRAALERAHREGIRVVRVGRATLIDRAEWDRAISSRTSRRGAVEVAADDAKTLERMGLRLVGGARG